MQLPPSSHFIYIPAILVLGLVMGFIFGARATREALRLEQRAADERARRKVERAARHAAEGQPPPKEEPPATT
jgi:hypothetical protein